jgi:hypothetical protein
VSFPWPWPRRTSYSRRCRAVPDLGASLAGVEPEPWLGLLLRGFRFYRSPIVLGVCGCLATTHPSPAPCPSPAPAAQPRLVLQSRPDARCAHARSHAQPDAKGVDPGGLVSASSPAPSARRTCRPALPPRHP